ncbi:unnamed protein product [Urochloa decumbens]|uniref:GH18 domain-containing protein n=1 Tax=Urochloa decumbens TaxID=240449 RepID=A0ABC9B260_9POAL
MAFRLLRPCNFLVLLSLLAAGSLAATGPGDIAVFWGRNKDEGTLREACDTGTYNTVIISFLTGFGAHGTYTLDLSGHPLAVLLSIGGPSSSSAANYSLPSPHSAADLADYLWNAFLTGGRAGVLRPFGDAQVNGVDFFIDQGSDADHYDEHARRLYGYNKYYRGGGITLAATVSCTYRPDNRLAAALATSLFGRIHVKMFGGDLRCDRVFVGVVASPEADKDAYLFQKDLYYGILQFAEKLPNYGGLMIWDRYYDKKNHYISSS